VRLRINTGDGAGILMQMPHKFLRRSAQAARITLPAPASTAAAWSSCRATHASAPQDRRSLRADRAVRGPVVFLGWRTVPTTTRALGETALSCEPFMRQVFIGRNPTLTDELAFERKLYVIRKRAYSEIRTSTLDGADYWYVASLSCKTSSTRACSLTEQVDQYFPDLRPAMESALALVHSRFSTNTFPSWERAHPYRYIAHNGEINTLRGNINWMHAREALFESPLFGDDVKKIFPIINPNGSDSAMFDNVLELLVLAAARCRTR
jgi:glutamate synthase (NADPH/NADH) large chain